MEDRQEQSREGRERGEGKRERMFMEDREKLWAGRDLGMAGGPLVTAHIWRTWRWQWR